MKTNSQGSHSNLMNIYIPRRHIIILLGCFGMLNVYAMRINLSLAIVAMTNHTAINIVNSSTSQVSECSNLIQNQTIDEVLTYKGEKYNWNSKTQGIILGAYYYGYVITQLPGGILAEKLGAKWVYGGGILATSIFSLLCPLAVSWGTSAFISLRVLQGLADNGFLSAIPFILQLFVSLIASWAADKLRKANVFSITVIRKLFNTLGMTAPAICLIAVTQSGCRPELIVALLSIGLGIDGCVFSGYNITPVDMTPNFSGTIYGIANTIASLSGFIAPMVVGIFLESGATMANWSKVFYTTIAIYFIFAVNFIIFASGELQPWNSAKLEAKKECNNERNMCLKNATRELSHNETPPETIKC